MNSNNSDQIVYDPVAEKVLISTMLGTPKSVSSILPFIKGDDWHSDIHRAIDGAMRAVLGDGDTPTVSRITQLLNNESFEQLIENEPRSSQGVARYLFNLSQGASDPKAIDYYLRCVKEASQKRKLQWVAEKLEIVCRDKKSKPESIRELLTEMQMVMADSDTTKIYVLKDLIQEHVIDPARNKTLSVAAGVSSGLLSWDRSVGGLRPGSLNVIAARPSIGKSTLAPIFAAAVVKETGKHVLFFSLEMLGESWAWREFSRLTSIKGETLRKDSQSGFDSIQESAIEKVERNEDLNKFLVIDRPDLHIDQIVGISRAQHDKHPLGTIVIDYLQLIEAEKSQRSRHEEVGNISGKLKQLAKELNLPIIALGQLNRSGEPGNPQISQMAQADKIAMDADTVTLIHRAADDTSGNKKKESDNASKRMGQSKDRIDADTLAEQRLEQGLEDLIITVDKARDGERTKFLVTHTKGLFQIEEPGTVEDQFNSAIVEANYAKIGTTEDPLAAFNQGAPVSEVKHDHTQTEDDSLF